MMLAVTMSREMGLVSGGDAKRIEALLERAGLPTRVRGVTPEQMGENMRIDKKVKQGRIRFVLLRSIGTAFVTADYAEPALSRALAAHLG